MGSEDALRMAGRTLGARRRSAEEPARANIAPRCVGAFGVPPAPLPPSAVSEVSCLFI